MAGVPIQTHRITIWEPTEEVSPDSVVETSRWQRSEFDLLGYVEEHSAQQKFQAGLNLTARTALILLPGSVSRVDLQAMFVSVPLKAPLTMRFWRSVGPAKPEYLGSGIHHWEATVEESVNPPAELLAAKPPPDPAGGG